MREPYYPAVQAGDWDILRAMFSFYQSILPVQEIRVQKYYNHSGAYFEETTALYGIMVDGVFGFLCDGTVPVHGNPTIRLHWDGSLELCLLMVDYYRYTADNTIPHRHTAARLLVHHDLLPRALPASGRAQ